MLFQNEIPCLEEITTKLLIQSHLEHGEERWKKGPICTKVWPVTTW